MPKLRGFYQHAWFNNQTKVRRAPEILSAFEEAGIPTLVLKGGALCPLYYREWGVRGMDDLDLLVPPGQAREAMGVLRGLGCVPKTARAEETIPLRPAAPFPNEAENWEVDLHWYSLFRSSDDASLWEHAVPLELNGKATLGPGPTHALIHVCVHGADYNEQNPIRWVADAYTVMTGSEVDWELLEREANEKLLTVVLASAARATCASCSTHPSPPGWSSGSSGRPHRASPAPASAPPPGRSPPRARSGCSTSASAGWRC